jgi:thymidine phosphorylase
VAHAAGLPNVAWITDMNQVLGRSCGNAVEVLEAVRFLRNEEVDARLAEITRTLAAEMLVMGHLAPDVGAALKTVDAALSSGAALVRFERMVVALGGPAGFAERPHEYMSAAPVRRDVVARSSGWVDQVATRDIGIALIALGGGRRSSADRIDPRVGFTGVAAPGLAVAAGDVLATVHAANEADARAACATLERAIHVGDARPTPSPILVERVSAASR